jgi:hypothetical protein
MLNTDSGAGRDGEGIADKVWDAVVEKTGSGDSGTRY